MDYFFGYERIIFFYCFFLLFYARGPDLFSFNFDAVTPPPIDNPKFTEGTPSFVVPISAGSIFSFLFSFFKTILKGFGLFLLLLFLNPCSLKDIRVGFPVDFSLCPIF